jgi:hypothetical protein
MIHFRKIAKMAHGILGSEAWYTAMTTDPLADSDEEADEHTRLDYSKDYLVSWSVFGTDEMRSR